MGGTKKRPGKRKGGKGGNGGGKGPSSSSGGPGAGTGNGTAGGDGPVGAAALPLSHHTTSASPSPGGGPGSRRPVFHGGDNILLKCPSHKFDSTVAFYREILRLPVEQYGRDVCAIGWGSGMRLWVCKTDRLSHPSVWLTVDTEDVAAAKEVLNKRAILRSDVKEPLAESVDGFWASPLNDMVHLIKAPGDLSLPEHSRCKPLPSPPPSEADSGNPLDVAHASHFPAGQKGKVTSCGFSGGANIAIKCPETKYLPTVAFYRETLGLKVLHFCRNCCKIVWNKKMALWIDCVPALSSVATWLEVSTANTTAAREYLRNKKKVFMRAEVEVLPPGVDGFWISPPNDMVHLIRGPDGKDDVALPEGQLSALPFLSDEEAAAELAGTHKAVLLKQEEEAAGAREVEAAEEE